MLLGGGARSFSSRLALSARVRIRTNLQGNIFNGSGLRYYSTTTPPKSYDWRNPRAFFNQISKDLLRHGYRTLLTIPILIGLGAPAIFYREQIQEYIAKKGASVASISLQHEEVKEKGTELAKAVLDQVFNHYLKDGETQQKIIDFVKLILNDKTTLTSCIQLANQLLQDPAFKAVSTSMAKEIATSVLNDPSTRDQIVVLVQNVMATQETKDNMGILLRSVLSDPVNIQAAEVFFKQVLQSQQVNEMLGQTAEFHVHKVFDDEKVLVHLQQFITSVLNDPQLQLAAGNAIWESTKIGLLPSYFNQSKSKITKTGEPPEDLKELPTENSPDFQDLVPSL